MQPEPEPSSVLVIGCGALAREMLHVAEELPNVTIECLPATLHNRPERIPAAVRSRLEAARERDHVFVAYGDCGTGGELDRVLEEFGVERLPGDHCYEFYSGSDVFNGLRERELGTFYLTDFLARHFERIVWHGLGLDRWPQLRDDYFANYHRLVYLAQTHDPARTEEAKRAAGMLGLEFERRFVGYGDLSRSLITIATRGAA